MPGLDAKSIIDIPVAVPSRQVILQLGDPLRGLGYLYRGDAGGDGGHLFVRESAPEVRTHHLHVVEVNDPQWRQSLLFRDMLRVPFAANFGFRGFSEVASSLNDRKHDQVANEEWPLGTCGGPPQPS